MSDKKVVHCSFCGTADTNVEVMVTGEAGVAICTTCVEKARDAVGHHRLHAEEALRTRLAVAEHLISELEEHEGAESFSQYLRDELAAFHKEEKR